MIDAVRKAGPRCGTLKITPLLLCRTTEKPDSRKAAKYAKFAKKTKDFFLALLCAFVRQPTDELFWFFHSFLRGGLNDSARYAGCAGLSSEKCLHPFKAFGARGQQADGGEDRAEAGDQNRRSEMLLRPQN